MKMGTKKKKSLKNIIREKLDLNGSAATVITLRVCYYPTLQRIEIVGFVLFRTVFQVFDVSSSSSSQYFKQKISQMTFYMSDTKGVRKKKKKKKNIERKLTVSYTTKCKLERIVKESLTRHPVHTANHQLNLLRTSRHFLRDKFSGVTILYTQKLRNSSGQFRIRTLRYFSFQCANKVQFTLFGMKGKVIYLTSLNA